MGGGGGLEGKVYGWDVFSTIPTTSALCVVMFPKRRRRQTCSTRR